MKIKEISDTRGISERKLKHIFLGHVNGNRVSGFHCDRHIGDELVCAERIKYPYSVRVITRNAKLGVFDGVVYSKGTNIKKRLNNGISSFYNEKWTRQYIVNCIHRAIRQNEITSITYDNGKTVSALVDPYTKLIIQNNNTSAFPLLRL